MSAVRAIRGAAVGPVRGAQRLLGAHKSWATQRIETTATGLGSFARILQGGVEVQALCCSGAHRRVWAAHAVRFMADGVTGQLESVSEEEKLTGGGEKYAATGEKENEADDEYWRGVRTAGEAPELPVVLELVEEKKGIDVVVLDAREYTALGMLCQAMVVVTCTSRRHMKVMGTNIVDHYKLKGMLMDREDENGRRAQLPPGIEGAESDRWMLVDLGEIIVQIFSREGREYYKLEDHWKEMEEAKKRKMSLEDYLKSLGREDEFAQPPPQYS